MNSRPTLMKLADLTGAKLVGKSDFTVSELCIDSRKLTSTAEVLFIALHGEQHDGHCYIGELYNRGVRAFLVSEKLDYAAYPEAGFLIYNDSLEGLQRLASARRDAFHGEVCAITGSNGKTIVKEWIHQVLAGLVSMHRSPKSYNSQVGVPLSLWGMEKEHRLAVIEAGISQPGEMSKLEGMIRPETGIFTHLGSAHQEHFRNLDEKFREKAGLFHHCKKLIYRADIRMPSAFPCTETPDGSCASWSLEGKAPLYNYVFSHGEKGKGKIQLDLRGEKLEFTLPFRDEASVENALHVLTFCLEYGIEAKVLIPRMAALEPVSMRLQILQGIWGSTLINDSYNSDTAGLSAALEFAAQHDAGAGRVLILSDLYQSGMEEEELYGEISSLLSRYRVDSFIGIGPACARNRHLFPSSALFYPDRDSFLEQFDKSQLANRSILVKGSRPFGFEQIVKEFQLKMHATRLEIDLPALVGNLNYFRSKLQPGVDLMVMVKALSYGSGNVEVARLLQFHQVDYLTVAFIDEGVELRKAGIHLPLMVLNPDPGGFDTMIEYQLEPEIYSEHGFEALDRVLTGKGIEDYPVHLKLDTGMHRLGFMEDHEDMIVHWLSKPSFRLKSIFTHLAAAGDPEHDDFTRIQLAGFERSSSKLMKRLGTKVKRHVLNTPGIERFPDARYDMVRLGIGLYGIGEAPELEPVSTLISTISQVRTIQAGDSVGYSRMSRVERESRVATIPLGYADGFPRTLGNGAGKIYAGGKLLPTIGNICMDMCMIDVTGTDLKEGDVVEIFGRNQSVAKLAEQAGTISYEILASLSERIKRVYMQE